MVWDEYFCIILLSKEFHRKFIRDKEVANTKKVSGALIAFSMESPEAVKKFAEAANKTEGISTK